MEKSDHREKILNLVDQMIQMTKDDQTFPFDQIKEKVHELFEHASLDANPITDEKQNALKSLMIALYKLEHPAQGVNKESFIQALNLVKSVYHLK